MNDAERAAWEGYWEARERRDLRRTCQMLDDDPIAGPMRRLLRLRDSMTEVQKKAMAQHPKPEAKK